MMAHGGPGSVLGTGSGRVFWGFHWILAAVTWIAVIALLIVATRYFWKKAGK